MDDGHFWYLKRYDTVNGVPSISTRQTATVRTEAGDALDSFLDHVFTGIRDGTLEVVMSEDD